MDEELYHIAYVSTGRDGLKYEDIKEILESANRKNKDHFVTGVLVYCNKHFFQIIEGNKDDIQALFSLIMADSRHDNIIKIQEGAIKNRHFANWSMAFKSYNKELRNLDNFNNEQFYTYINERMTHQGDISLKILADFFDLNG